MDHEPIFTSRLDMDLYKFRMQQVALLKHLDVRVRLGFHCRTKNAMLARYVDIDDLRREIMHFRTLKVHPREIAYLAGLGYFRKEYLEFFESHVLPPVDVVQDGDGFRIETEDRYPNVMPWETVILGIVNELYFRGRKAEMAREQGKDILELEEEIDRFTDEQIRAKIRFLLDHPSIRISEFGTRRRESRRRQMRIISDLVESDLVRTGQLLGTSNVGLARLHSLRPIGTMGHELYMIQAALARGDDAALLASPLKVLDDWREIADSTPATARNDKALTDTFGSRSFFRDLTVERMLVWKGFRGDSGSPIAWTDTAVGAIGQHGIDSTTKAATYADGIEIPTLPGMRTNLVEIDEYVRGKIAADYGPGTNLTNDLECLGLPPISIVVKPISANGWPTVKISDNPAKAMGPDAEVARVKRVFRYEEMPRVECKY